MPKRNGEKGEMAAASSYAWPSVVVYRGATVAKRQTIVKCDWSDNIISVSYWRSWVTFCMYYV